MPQDDRSGPVSRDRDGSDQQRCSVTATRPEQHGRCSDDTCGSSLNASRFDKIEQQRVELREYMERLFAQLNERLDRMT